MTVTTLYAQRTHCYSSVQYSNTSYWQSSSPLDHPTGDLSILTVSVCVLVSCTGYLYLTDWFLLCLAVLVPVCIYMVMAPEAWVKVVSVYGSVMVEWSCVNGVLIYILLFLWILGILEAWKYYYTCCVVNPIIHHCLQIVNRVGYSVYLM